MNSIISILGVQTELIPMQRDKLKGLNADLLLRFAYYTIVFNNNPLCIIRAKNNDSLTPLKYKSITERIEKITGMPVAVWMDALPYYERERFISQGVYFIVSDKYAFLPSLIANIKAKNVAKQSAGLTPAAQYLFLYYLLDNSNVEYTIRQLETILPYNYLAISRAVINLENLQLCKSKKDDTGTKIICFEHSRCELWENAQKYLSSPIKKILYSDSLPEGDFSISGINALSHYSHLNPEQYATMAIWDKTFSELSMQCNEIEGNYKIEIWKYPAFMPNISDNKIVDKLSLFLSLKEEPDARVEKELEILIENMSW
ncbi:hypothetical protein FACS1894203_0060 [Bacteroidia bacterium]|nr:hypothetical protein FACS1894203_0060 [Bacteroidia bacterium]